MQTANSSKPTRVRAALFDLDGTLIDSVPDIAEAVAELLATEGLPRQPDEAVRKMVGRGVPTLVERAFIAAGRPLDAEGHAMMVERMMEIYPRHLVAKTVLMPGVREALDALAARGIKLAIVTNKPEVFCEEILSHMGLLNDFDLVLGDRPAVNGRLLARKPAPDMLLFALEELGVPPAEAIMVGDSGNDIESAKAGNIYAVGIRGGYTPAPLEEFGADIVLDTMAELPRVI
ncbi:MAG TPA: HAD-IA family hydrolase [Devosiaceae bacterium]|nr:HAD-IA family hydrolase [Devosiaceae bacterium]